MLNVLLVAIAVGLLAATLRVWLFVIRRWSQGLPLVDRVQRQAVPWGLIDVVITILLLFVISGLAINAVDRRFGVTADTPPEALSLLYYRWKISSMALGSLVTLIASCGMITLRYRLSLRDSQWIFNTWHDLRLGAAAFLLLAPPIYALQLLLVQWVASKHPIVELLRERPDPGLDSGQCRFGCYRGTAVRRVPVSRLVAGLAGENGLLSGATSESDHGGKGRVATGQRGRG